MSQEMELKNKQNKERQKVKRLESKLKKGREVQQSEAEIQFNSLIPISGLQILKK